MSALRNKFSRIAVLLAAATLVSAFASPTASASTSAETVVNCFDQDGCFTGIRAATHTGYDRLVFDLTTGTRILDTSTNTTGIYYGNAGYAQYLTVKGNSYLFITMEPSYPGDGAVLDKTLSLPTIKGVQLTQYHAARTTFGISLGPSTRYNVFQLTSPNRVVVDVYR
ncbi:AMIN-like domain-containing (lipo)protein [Streptomyces zaomyceticus]|uniref:AMIN-like domain-containing (lipo)protein n=1 Tax=Streptomyces zaomyceticus TaxID=68286 RepID=UPI003447CE25